MRRHASRLALSLPLFLFLFVLDSSLMSGRFFCSMFLQTFHNTFCTIICISTGFKFPERKKKKYGSPERRSRGCLRKDQFVAWLLIILILLPAIAPLQFPDSTNIDQFCLWEVAKLSRRSWNWLYVLFRE